MQSPGAENAPRERDGLFDIVRWELPKTIRRRAAGSAVLILRSARVQTLPQSQTSVRASRRMRTVTACPHASRRIAAQPTRASVCARAAMLLSMRARRILAKRSQTNAARVVPAKAGTHNHGLWLWVPALRPLRGRRPGRRSFMRTENQPVAAANAYRLRSIVSGLLFTMTRATCACTGTAADFGETNPMRILAKRTQCDVSESGG